MKWVSNCFTEAAKHVTAFAQYVTTFVSHLWVDHDKQTEEGLTTGCQVAVDVSDVENPRILLLDEAVVINVNQTEMGVSDTTTLVHQIPLGAQATRTFDVENPRGQNSRGVANVVLGVPSQRSGPPPRPNAGNDIDIQALLTEAKEVANWVTFISAGGIFSGLSAVIGNEKAVLIREDLFKALMILSYVSLVSGLALYYLIKKSPKTRGFVEIVKFTIYFTQGTLVCGISCGICLIFPSKVEVGFILVAPLIPIGLVPFLALLVGTRDRSIP